jgi:hypothetical protein
MGGTWWTFKGAQVFEGNSIAVGKDGRQTGELRG